MSVNPGKAGKWRARVAGLPREGRVLAIDANEAERKEIVEAFDLLALPSFRADLRLAPAGRDGVRLTGTLQADVAQACVVTLEPVESHVTEDIERVFVPGAGEDIAGDPDVSEAEIIVDLDAADPPEPFDGVALDLKAILLEHFALALDPYPRKPGVEGPPAPDDDGEKPGGAFAALERLKIPKKSGKR